MSQMMQVACTGSEYEPHARVVFEIELDPNSGQTLQYAVQDKCPVCQLREKITQLENTVNGQWDDLRKARDRASELKDMVDALRPMREWWEATCQIQSALEQPDPNDPGDPA